MRLSPISLLPMLNDSVRGVSKMRLLTAIAVVGPLIFSTSCSITGVKYCGPENRLAEVYGWVFLADGSPMANGSAILFESRNPGQAEVAGLAVNFQSDSLRGHVIKVELHDSQTPSRLLGTYPILSVSGTLPPNIVGFQGPYDWPIPIEEGRALIIAGQVVIEAQTDIASQPLVRFPLTSVGSNDWSRESGESCR